LLYLLHDQNAYQGHRTYTSYYADSGNSTLWQL